MSEQFPPRAWIPNAVTLLNIGVGFGAMLAATEGELEVAVYLLLLAIILDLSDGRLARELNATSRLGLELDSLSDMVSFGVAPAFLLYQSILRPLGAGGVVVAMIYVLCGAFRLARFNLLADAHNKSKRTVGVPIPLGAGYLMAVVLMRDRIPIPVAMGVVFVVAYGMIARWRLPELKGNSVVSTMLVVGLFNFFAVIAWPSWYTVGWWNVWNLSILMAALAEDRRESPDGAGAVEESAGSA